MPLGMYYVIMFALSVVATVLAWVIALIIKALG
jgi:hypothetical protein